MQPRSFIPRTAILLVLLAAGSMAKAQAPPQPNAPTPANVRYELVISEVAGAPAGAAVSVLVVNGTSPGPVLRFTEGDRAYITVKNQLVSEETSIHWHGLLLPNDMDGVPYLTTAKTFGELFRILNHNGWGSIAKSTWPVVVISQEVL